MRRADGSPLGTLREWGAIGPVLDLLPAPGLGEQAAALAEVSALFAAAGITWVQDAWVDPDQVDAWLAAAAAGPLRFRANLAFRAEPTIVEGPARRIRRGPRPGGRRAPRTG